MKSSDVAQFTDFRQRLASMSEVELEQFVRDILERSGSFPGILYNARAGDFQYDIIAMESPLSGPRWLFEVKSLKVLDSREVRFASILAERMRAGEAYAHFVIATSGDVTNAAASLANAVNVEIWDPPRLFELSKNPGRVLDSSVTPKPSPFESEPASQKARRSSSTPIRCSPTSAPR